MPFLQIIFFCFVSLMAHTAVALTDEDLLPPDQAFKISAKAVSSDQLEISWDIAEGYYLYRNKMQFESKTEQIRTVTPVFPEGETKHDDLFGDVVIYRNNLRIPVSLIATNKASSIQLQVQYHGCTDRGICYPPQKKIFDIALPAATPVAKTNPLELLVKSLPELKFKSTEDELLPPDQAFQFFATVKDAGMLHVNWEIAEGYYLYREQIRLELINAADVKIGDYTIPKGTPKQDEAFGQVEIFHNELGFDLPIIRANSSAQTITLQAKYQGCADRGVCYPPMTKKIDLELPAAQNITPIADTHPNPALSEQDQIVRSLQQDSLAMTLLSFFGFGLLLSMTPCIFPMIPILSGIIVGHGHRITTAKAFLLSLSYVVASAFTYTVFGILAALFGSNLQTTFQQPWIIGLFSAIFVLLSLSMFGFYELELPNALKTQVA